MREGKEEGDMDKETVREGHRVGKTQGGRASWQADKHVNRHIDSGRTLANKQPISFASTAAV